MKRLTFNDLQKVKSGEVATFRIADPVALDNARMTVYRYSRRYDVKIETKIDQKQKTITVTRL